MRAYKLTTKIPLRVCLSLILIITLVLMGLPEHNIATVQAQNGTNLLENGGFEGDYVTVRGDVTKQVAVGWEPWNVEVTSDDDGDGGLNREPEYTQAPNNRIRTGEAAQEYNTFFAPHDAGLFQRVPVEAGSQLRFEAFIYVWSSTDFTNLNESVDPQGVEVQVGIDPAGGTDPESPNIEWSDEAEYYDEYRENSVTAVATSAAVTVYIRSAVQGDEGVTAIYVDDASLELLTVVTPDTETPTTETPTTQAPTTQAPTTQAATTQAPTTQAPTTQAPTTQPVTETSVPPERTPYSSDLPNELTHTVTFGDTVIDLAQRYNSTVDAIIAYNDLSANGVIFVNQELLIPVPAGQGTPVIQPGGGQGDETTYVVQPGDTLFRIATNNNTTVAQLAQYNGILNPARIFPGQEILIPPADTTVPSTSGPPTAVPIGGQAPAQVTPIAPPVQPVPQNFIDPTGALIHIVQPGENIFRIGLIYNVTWDRIARANGIFNPNFVIAGQRLVIPR